jgi:hypothetical protein
MYNKIISASEASSVNNIIRNKWIIISASEASSIKVPYWEPLMGGFIYIYVRTLDTIQTYLGVCLIKDISNKGYYYFKYSPNHIFSFLHGLLFSFRYI